MRQKKAFYATSNANAYVMRFSWSRKGNVEIALPIPMHVRYKKIHTTYGIVAKFYITRRPSQHLFLKTDSLHYAI